MPTSTEPKTRREHGLFMAEGGKVCARYHRPFRGTVAVRQINGLPFTDNEIPHQVEIITVKRMNSNA